MNFQPNHVYHVYNQGNKQTLFKVDEDYLCFLRLTKNLIASSSNIIAYCLMPNHFHFLLATDERCLASVTQGNLQLDVITNGFRKLLSSYSRITNKKYSMSGSLFRQKTKAKCLSEASNLHSTSKDYYNICFHYIHQNPLRAKIIERLEDWNYSSFRDYAGLRNGTLINKKIAEKICAFNPKYFLRESYSLIEHFE